MKIIGIIMESNPFHNGHKYFINKIKDELNPDLIIAITSTSFTMRGEISVQDKFSKISSLLEHDVDLVFELPTSNSLQSAKEFACNSLKTLIKLGVTDIAFGSEVDDLSFYEKCYSILSKNNTNNNTISKKQNINLYLEKNGFSLNEITKFNQPNFTLSFEYYKYIKDNNLNTKINIIKRFANNYHDFLPTSSIASATSIRNCLLNNQDISNYIPNKINLFDLNKAYDKLFNIIKYELLINNKKPLIDKEGINNYIINNGDFSEDYHTLVNSLKNKKYTISRINRTILQTLLCDDIKECDYLRLLGFSNKGITYINSLEKKIKNLIFSTINDKITPEINSILEIEMKATRLYDLITDNNNYLMEFKLPIRKEE